MYLDQDYTDKLSPEDKDWLVNFNMAYYLGESPDPKNALSGHQRKKLNERDLMANGKQKATQPKIKAPKRYYTLDDYSPASVISFADALIEAIDQQSLATVHDIKGKP